RMQVFLWNGPTGNTLTLNPGGVVASGVAAYGPSSFNASGGVVLANDGALVVTDACQALVNNVAGKIVLADRGTCSFKTKSLVAQSAGAAGLIIADNAPNAAPPGLG